MLRRIGVTCCVIVLAVIVFGFSPRHNHQPRKIQTIHATGPVPGAEPQTPGSTFESTELFRIANEWHEQQRQWGLHVWQVEQDRQAAEKKAEEAAQAARARTSARTNAPAATGACSEMAPPGFDPAIIQRESGGNPAADNGQGYHGCAQIADSHFNQGAVCGGLGYKECWAKMFGMAQRGEIPDPWACTPESGCG